MGWGTVCLRLAPHDWGTEHIIRALLTATEPHPSPTGARPICAPQATPLEQELMGKHRYLSEAHTRDISVDGWTWRGLPQWWHVTVGGPQSVRQRLLLTALSSLFTHALPTVGSAYVSLDVTGGEDIVTQLIFALKAMHINITVIPEAFHGQPLSNSWELRSTQPTMPTAPGNWELYKIGNSKGDKILASSASAALYITCTGTAIVLLPWCAVEKILQPLPTHTRLQTNPRASSLSTPQQCLPAIMLDGKQAITEKSHPRSYAKIWTNALDEELSRAERVQVAYDLMVGVMAQMSQSGARISCVELLHVMLTVRSPAGGKYSMLPAGLTNDLSAYLQRQHGLDNESNVQQMPKQIQDCIIKLAMYILTWAFWSHSRGHSLQMRSPPTCVEAHGLIAHRMAVLMDNQARSSMWDAIQTCRHNHLQALRHEQLCQERSVVMPAEGPHTVQIPVHGTMLSHEKLQ